MSPHSCMAHFCRHLCIVCQGAPAHKGPHRVLQVGMAAAEQVYWARRRTSKVLWCSLHAFITFGSNVGGLGARAAPQRTKLSTVAPAGWRQLAAAGHWVLVVGGAPALPLYVHRSDGFSRAPVRVTWVPLEFARTASPADLFGCCRDRAGLCLCTARPRLAAAGRHPSFPASPQPFERDPPPSQQ